MGATHLIFTPLDTVCERATQINQELARSILEGIKSDKYSPGLRKQYELQLKWLKDKVPSIELVFAPVPIFPLSESTSRPFCLILE